MRRGSSSAKDSPKAASGRPQIFNLDPRSRIPLFDDLSYHHVRGVHLWIETSQGLVVVLNDKEQSLFEKLREGLTPAVVLAMTCAQDRPNQKEIESRWFAISELVGKLARSGFVKGIQGYHDVKALNPGRFARLHLTRRCQLSCIHCYATSGPNVDTRSDLPTGRWLRFIDGFAANNGESILFTGGEPLMRDDCPLMMRRAKNKGLRVTLFTNGLLAEERVHEFATCVDLVQVSLDGIDKESHEVIRGKDTFYRTLRGIDALVRANVPVQIGMTVMKENWPAIRNGFPEFAKRYQGANVEFNLSTLLFFYGRAARRKDNLDADEVTPIVRQYMSAVNRKEQHAITRKIASCGYCEQMVLSSNGWVYPCQLLDDPIGHIDEHPMSAWSSILQDIAKKHQVDFMEGCEGCDLRYLCGGTCRVINRKRHGSRMTANCTQDDRAVKYSHLVRLFQDDHEGKQGLQRGSA